jgi:AhpD family alkylhydroperoxidase
MQARLDFRKYVGSGMGQALLKLQREIETAGLEPSLLALVKMRTSQMNGCAYCIDMHSKDARVIGGTEQRLYALNAWRETPFFTARERAALEWTEAIANIAATHAPDDVYERVREQFTEAEFVTLTFAAAAINVWNRLVIPFRVPAGTYQAQGAPATASAS